MGWTSDFWTGFYTSRPHLKGFIFHVHNEIIATKVLMVNSILRKNSYSLTLTKELEYFLHTMNNNLTLAM